MILLCYVKTAKKTTLQLILNRIRTKMVRKGEMMDANDIVELLSVKLIGAIPDDENVIIQTNKGEPSVTNPKSLSGKAYMETAKRMAEHRQAVMEAYLEEFMAEWEGER